MHPQPFTVSRHPFNSPEARHLVSSLEANLAAIYPDWDDLIHPGMHHENNPRPPPPAATSPAGSIPDTAASTIEDDLASGLVFFVARPDIVNSDAGGGGSGSDSAPEAIGCGALRLFHSSHPLPPELDPALSYAEVKRMFVLSSYRGQGAAKCILSEMEHFAKTELGVEVIVLEVGLRQKAAVKLYQSIGYASRDMFGEYVGSDVASGGQSACFEKRL